MNVLPHSEHVRLVSMYLAGTTVTHVALTTGHTRNTVKRALRLAGVTVRPVGKWSDADVVSLVPRYIAGEPALSLVSTRGQLKHFYRLLRKRGLVRTRGRYRTRCNETFFDVIDTEPKAYWLGFIAADGCVVETPDRAPRLQIQLAAQDAAHLDMFAIDIDFMGALSTDSTRRKQGMFISSNVLAAGLMRHGITPRKSLTLTFPITIPPHLIRHYIRGYFDGDGTVHGTSARAQFGFIGTRDFLDSVRAILNTTAINTASDGFGAICKVRNADPRIVTLMYGKRAVRSIYPYLYDGATRYLSRKHEKFLSILAP